MWSSRPSRSIRATKRFFGSGVRPADPKTSSVSALSAIYLLRGPSGPAGTEHRIYIGEADVPRARLDQHLSKKDFWTHLILFTSKDVNLAKAHIRYTESQLYQLAQQAKRAEIDNETTPQLPALSEADTADAEAFLDDMRLIYPMLGVSALEPAEEIAPSTDRLRLEGSDARAEGRDTPEGFVVFEWSLARRDTVRSLADWGNWVIGIRESLVQQGLLVADNSHLRLTQNYVFKSPSAAAGVMLGRTANRLVEWKDEQGRTLKQIGEEALGDQETSDPASEPELEISEAL